MSDTDEHRFESKADAGASKTYPQQAGTIRKSGHVVIKNRPCKETDQEVRRWRWIVAQEKDREESMMLGKHEMRVKEES